MSDSKTNTNTPPPMIMNLINGMGGLEGLLSHAPDLLDKLEGIILKGVEVYLDKYKDLLQEGKTMEDGKVLKFRSIAFEFGNVPIKQDGVTVNKVGVFVCAKRYRKDKAPESSLILESFSTKGFFSMLLEKAKNNQPDGGQ